MPAHVPPLPSALSAPPPLEPPPSTGARVGRAFAGGAAQFCTVFVAWDLIQFIAAGQAPTQRAAETIGLSAVLTGAVAGLVGFVVGFILGWKTPRGGGLRYRILWATLGFTFLSTLLAGYLLWEMKK